MIIKPLFGPVIVAALLGLIAGCGGGGSTPIVPATTHIFVVDAGNGRIVEIDSMTGANWASLGTNGSGVGQFSDPTGVAFDSAGRIYVADYNNNRIVRVDDIAGTNWVSFGSSGSGTNQFSHPYKIAIDSLDRIYVTDSSNNRVIRFDDMTGGNWVAFGSIGSGNNQFAGPIGIDVSSTFQVFVSDWANHRVVRFDDMTGTNFTAYGTTGFGTGQFDSAVDLALDGAGHMLITDRGGRLIQTNVMSSTGWTEFSTDTPQSASYFGGKIYTVDQSVYKVTRINSILGAGLLTFGSSGSGINQFSSPVAVRVK